MLTEIRDKAEAISVLDMDRNRLEELQRRLDKVHSWGGEFSQVEFSPEVIRIVYENSRSCDT